MKVYANNIWCLRKDYIGEPVIMDNKIVGKISDVTEHHLMYDIDDEYEDIFMNGKGTYMISAPAPTKGEHGYITFSFDKRSNII